MNLQLMMTLSRHYHQGFRTIVTLEANRLYLKLRKCGLLEVAKADITKRDGEG